MARPLPQGDSYRPSYGAEDGLPRPPPDAQMAMYHFEGNQNFRPQHDAPRRPPRAFNFRPPRPKIAERALLTSKREPSPELTFGRADATEKFREVVDLTDTDETDMDVSESDEPAQPAKRIRLDDSGNLPDAAPRWSNPDPYTALPPPDETTRKQKDFVRLIRKARVIATATETTVDSATRNEDFISLDFGGDGNEEISEDDQAPPNAPTAPKGQPADNGRASLGKRKRPMQGEDSVLIKKRGGGFHTDGSILREWRPFDSCNPSPWFQPSSAGGIEPPGAKLHKEIIDFYEWVKPQEFEAKIRRDVIARLQKAFERIEPGCQVKAFGSFAAGLYLPTGDMDLVLLQRGFSSKKSRLGLPAPPNKGLLYSFRAFIGRQQLARPGTITLIPSAKVPIIKFVDNVSGLKIDLSFNNDSGLIANQTFEDWKARYPAMPMIVSIIKQFLMTRGLNDVSTGGLGGFSIICLVTSLIQHLPLTGQPPNLGSLLVEFFNLYGNLFNRYSVGIRLEPPGYIDKKQYSPFVYNKDKPDRLAIVDPNRPENNISGGTGEIGLIFQCFSQAHESLEQRMAEQMDAAAPSRSLLVDIIGGDFTAYQIQREYLWNLHDRLFGIPQSLGIVPPPPPGLAPVSAPPPPPPISANSSAPVLQQKAQPLQSAPQGSTNAANMKKKTPQAAKHKAIPGASGQVNPNGIPLTAPKAKAVTKNVKRAQRMKRLRPDIPNIPHELKTEEALRLGAYADLDTMERDLQKRASRKGKKQKA